MAISLELLGADALRRGLARSRETVAQEDLRAMTASLVLVEADARRHVVHDTRQLMNSIGHRITTEREHLVGRVGPSARYGFYVEFGRRPMRRPPPRAALRGWARRHGIPERALFVVARAIGRRGLAARPFMVPALARNVDRIRRLFGASAERITVRIAGQA